MFNKFELFYSEGFEDKILSHGFTLTKHGLITKAELMEISYFNLELYFLNGCSQLFYRQKKWKKSVKILG